MVKISHRSNVTVPRYLIIGLILFPLQQSQHDDLETDFSKLQTDKEKDKEDHKLQEEQQNTEYQQFKQEKALEISSLRGNVQLPSLCTQHIKIVFLPHKHKNLGFQFSSDFDQTWYACLLGLLIF